MRYNRSRSSDQNFWVSYADLMAGLLFVFILLIGAIVVKYVYVQTDLKHQKQSLEQSEAELTQKKRDFLRLRSDMNQTSASLQIAQELLAQKEANLDETNAKLQLSDREIENLKKLLLDTELARDEVKGEFVASQMELGTTTQTLKLKEGELALLSAKLLESTASHQQLVEDLNITKARIKNLTGIRIKVIQELKNKLGKKINIDPNSGAIRLPSSVLFDVGSYELKPEAKKQLKETLQPYLDVLLNDNSIRENIDHIVIEGHTDSDGSYMHNLDLSQKRAYSVMAFIYSLDEKRTTMLQKYLSANGRSYSDLILKNGVEDKEASRRIEIKFNLSNKKAIEEIETFLNRKE
ncbi:OmpA family protein [Sulfurospirillum oryzae]|uniref:OmpA family protein n=1 Tax=Sulfurospirillum oryzae TaxID=2976535 RepID=UPI0021E81405|nr:OmpA family protein [Sulfurospirillum oryzae]